MIKTLDLFDYLGLSKYGLTNFKKRLLMKYFNMPKTIKHHVAAIDGYFYIYDKCYRLFPIEGRIHETKPFSYHGTGSLDDKKYRIYRIF